MFTTDNIISASKLRKNFSDIARKIAEREVPFLVSQKNGKYLVLLEAQAFEDLVKFQRYAIEEGLVHLND